MFLNYLKDFFTLKLVKKNMANVKLPADGSPIKTIGILFDEIYFEQKDILLQDLIVAGVDPLQIQFLVFKNSIKKNETFDFPVFSRRELSWRATFESTQVKWFMAQRFDLLINYYDVPKSALLIVSNQSKALFKVGFPSIDKKLNHFIINTSAENYSIFSTELIKYLKILNKL